MRNRACQGAFAAYAADVDNLVAIEHMLQKTIKDPGIPEQLGETLEEWCKMTAEELLAQIHEIIKNLLQHVVVAVLVNKEDVIQRIEASEAVPPEELTRYKTDDGYFEMKMREMCETIQQPLNTPNLLQRFTNALQNAFQDPEEALKRYKWNMEEWPIMTQ